MKTIYKITYKPIYKTLLRRAATVAILAALATLPAPPASANDYTIGPGSTLPAAGTVVSGDIITLTGNPASLTATYSLTGKSVTFRSDDPNIYRIISTIANNRLFDMQDGVTQTFDHIIITGGTMSGNNDGAGLRLSGGASAAATLNGDFILRNNINIGRHGGGLSSTINATLVFGGNVEFDGNKAAQRGGGLYQASGASLTFKGNAAFTSNTAGLNAATGGGGAVYINTAATTLTFEKSSTFTNNTTAFGNGGAISTAGSTDFMGEAFFSGNSAFANGGAIYSAGDMTFYSKVSLLDNTTTSTAGSSGNYGGAILMNTAGGELWFKDDAVISGNSTANGNGGAIRANGSIIADGDLFLANNTAGRSASFPTLSVNGGGLFVANNLTVAGVFTATGNTSAGSGGAVHLVGNGTFNGGSTFKNNTAQNNNGGAINWAPNAASSLTLTLDANTADILFDGNVANATASPNAIFIAQSTTAGFTHTLDLKTDAGRAIFFNDPIASNVSVSGGRILVNVSGSGAVAFDTHKSNIVADTTVSAAATMTLARGAIYGSSVTLGSFTLKSGALLSGNGAIAAAAITLENNARLEVTEGGTLTLDTTTATYGAGLKLSGHGAIDAGNPLSASLINVGVSDATAAPNTAQTLTLAPGSALTLENNGALVFDLFGGLSSDKLITDSLTLGGSASINLTGVSGVYTVITANNSLFNATDFTILVNGLTLTARYSATPAVNAINAGAGSELVIDFSEKNIAVNWLGAGGGADGDTWKNSATTDANWTDGAATPENYFKNGDRVIFGDAATVKNITIDTAGVTVADMTVNATSGSYTFAGAGGITASATATIASSTFTPTGKLVKAGAGTLNFANTSANTFAGGIEISEGAISFTGGNQLGDGGNGITFAGTGTLRPADGASFSNKLNIAAAATTAAVNVAAGASATYAGVLNGAAGSFAKIGPGTLHLTADNSAFGGDVLTDAGSLLLNASALRAVTIATGATFGGSGFAALVTSNAGSTLQVGLPGAAGILRAGTLTLAANTTLNYNILAANQSSALQVQPGGLNLLGSVDTYTLNMSDWLPGAYNLGNVVQFATPGAAAHITLKGSTLNSRQTYATGTAGGILQLTINQTANAVLVWSGTSGAPADNGAWNATAENWFDATVTTDRYAFADYDALVFDDRVASPAHRVIGLASPFTASAMKVGGDGAYRFTGPGGITTDAAGAYGITVDSKLTKTGPGTLTFANTGGNLFKGGIDLGAPGVTGGAVEFDHASQLAVSATAAINVLGDTTLRALAGSDTAGPLTSAIAIASAVTATIDTGANDLTLSGTLSTSGATGTLAKTGDGVLTLTGNSAGAAAANLVTTITAGALLLDAAALGGTVNIAANTRFGGAGSAATVRAAAGSILQAGLATPGGILDIASLQLAASSTLTAGAGGGVLTGAATLTGDSTALVDAGNSLTLSGVIGGAGSLTKTGAGNLVYTTAAALGYAGGTRITDGYVLFRGIIAADAAALAHTITLDGGWLDLSDAAAFDPAGDTATDWSGLNITEGPNATAGGVISANDMITIRAGNTAIAIGSDTNPGVFVVVDAGNATATLTGSNAYKGYTRIDSGTLQVTADTQLGDTAAHREIILNGGALQIAGAGFATARALQLRAATATVTTDAGASATFDSITLADADAHTFTKAGSGTLTIANASAATALHVDEGRYVALKNTGMAAGSGVVTVAAGATAEYQVTGANTTTANTFTGAGALVITGGTLTLTGASTDIARIAITRDATVTAAAGALGSAATTALSIDSSRVLLSSPVSALGAVTMNAGATLGFTPSAGNYKRATLSSLTGGGTLHLNANLGLGRADLLTIATVPQGDYFIIVSNTGTPTGFTAPITLVQSPTGAGARFDGAVIGNTSMYSYEISTRDDNGALTVQIAGTGALSLAGRIINATAGSLPLSWFSELNTVSQRLGELRLDTTRGRGGLSAWMRGHGQGLNFNGKATGTPFDERQIGADAGFDYKARAAALDVHLGAFLGYGRMDRKFNTDAPAGATTMPYTVNHAAGVTDSIHGGLYGTLTTKTGWYIDGILKVNGFDNTFSTYAITGETMDARYNTFAVGGSLEAGRRIDIGKGWYVEPQLQAACVILGGNEYVTTSGIDVELRWGTTTQTRAGLMIGRTFKTGFGELFQVYLKAHVASQWTTDMQLIADGERFTPTIKGDRVEGGGGLAWLPGSRIQIYVDFETAKASYYNKPWGINFGLRRGW
jgi:outer membrane autotransporter protein